MVCPRKLGLTSYDVIVAYYEVIDILQDPEWSVMSAVKKESNDEDST